MTSTSRSDRGAEDLTARARIRDAALDQFAEQGFDRATIRDIARAAGVSPGLVRHHFGSKDGLRQACDGYALQVLHGYVDENVTEQMLGDPRSFSKSWEPLSPFRRYIARAMIDGSEGAGQIFDELVTMTEQTLRQYDEQQPDPPVADLRTRSALMVAMALGVPAFRAHIGRNIGADIFSPEGERRVILAMLDIHSHPVMSVEAARGLAREVDKPAG